ncbi:hypothetical protein KC19_10G120900 [Ceratodon purpureus]|uniref:Uncharacterized protein n=1 Tax=Ceratodon purpureus TaxID=3225 RepID=A0A8T0GJE2_CERPU|nr:hypothetical protein KC19_10G120900 [Ceratodon purpureus]
MAPSLSQLHLWRRTTSALLLHRPLAATHQVRRGFAQERPEDSSTSNWGTGEPPIDEKATERGVKPGETKSDSDSGEVPTPNLSKQKSTRDFINTKREERMKAAQGTNPEVEKLQKLHEEVKETGAPHPGDVAGG